MIIILETGEGEWGLSLDMSPNPEATDYLQCDDRAQAERLAAIMNSPSDMARVAWYFLRDGKKLDCPKWGWTADGHYGPCRNCAACRLNEAA